MGRAGKTVKPSRLRGQPYVPIFRPLFPIITDDLVLRPEGGRSATEILSWHKQHR
jgi:hypothetical protein